MLKIEKIETKIQQITKSQNTKESKIAKIAKIKIAKKQEIGFEEPRS